MKLHAEVYESGSVAATVIAGPGDYPLEDAPMVDLGRGFHEIEFSADEGRDYLLAISLDGEPYSSGEFVGVGDPPEPAALTQAIPRAPVPPKGVRFTKKRPF